MAEEKNTTVFGSQILVSVAIYTDWGGVHIAGGHGLKVFQCWRAARGNKPTSDSLKGLHLYSESGVTWIIFGCHFHRTGCTSNGYLLKVSLKSI